jgi:hypothetical protein
MKRIIVETFWAVKEASKNRVRVHPLEGRGLSPELRVAFSLEVRYGHPPNTLFKVWVTEVDRQGTLFLKARLQDPWEVVTKEEADAFIKHRYGSLD